MAMEASHLCFVADDGEACWLGGELGLAEDDDSVFVADFLAGDFDDVEGVLLRPSRRARDFSYFLSLAKVGGWSLLRRRFWQRRQARMRLVSHGVGWVLGFICCDWMRGIGCAFGAAFSQTAGPSLCSG